MSEDQYSVYVLEIPGVGGELIYHETDVPESFIDKHNAISELLGGTNGLEAVYHAINIINRVLEIQNDQESIDEVQDLAKVICAHAGNRLQGSNLLYMTAEGNA